MSMKHFWKRMVLVLVCLVTVFAMTTPVSAAMADLAPVTADRQVSPVRYSPRLDSTIIGYLENGTPLKVLEPSGDFYRINCGSMAGYIHSDSVKVDDNACYYVNSSLDTTLPCQAPDQIDAITDTLLTTARDCLGTRYVYGGKTPNGFDCSGFVQYVYNQAGLDLNRTASQQLCNGLIVAEDKLLPGDIVFFRGTSSESGISSHVGIYIGGGEFIHASSSRGVIVSKLSSGYYKEHFLCARRVVLSCVADYTSATPNNSRSSGPVDRSFFTVITVPNLPLSKGAPMAYEIRYDKLQFISHQTIISG